MEVFQLETACSLFSEETSVKGVPRLNPEDVQMRASEAVNCPKLYLRPLLRFFCYHHIQKQNPTRRVLRKLQPFQFGGKMYFKEVLG